MTKFSWVAIGCRLVLLAPAICCAAPSLGGEEWRDDIEYLTWDVRADEAAAARADDANQPVYLSRPSRQQDTAWYESDGEMQRTSLVSRCQNQLLGIRQRIGEQTQRWFSVWTCQIHGHAAGGAAAADGATTIR